MMPKIMHVDDDGDTRKAVRTLLKTEGFKVTSAMNAKICLNRLREEKPDVILIDIMMPGKSGWDLFNQVKKRKIKTKIIFLSVLPVSEEKKKEMYKRGVVDYIMKPFTPEELITRVKKATAKPKPSTNKKLSINCFISRIKNKEKGKILSEVITYLLVLEVIKNKKSISCQEIIEQVLSELSTLSSSDLINNFLSNNEFKLQDEIKHQNLNNQIKKEFISRFNVFVGSNVLYSLLSKWRQIGIIKSQIVERNNVYGLTDKGDKGIKILSDYFLNILKKINNQKRDKHD